jgi:glycosyltransferase involved in cell wall biosynthesis
VNALTSRALREAWREMSGANDVSVIIPALNEESAIGLVIADIRAELGPGAEILVVDDGSTDATAARAAEAGATVIQHRQNMGYGAAIKTGLRAATQEVIVMTDADGTYPARHIPDLVSELASCDMAVGQRPGENVANPWLRGPAKWMLRQLAVFLARKPIPDLNSGLRAFRRGDALRFINLYPSGFSFTTTQTLAYLTNDLLVHYLPIEYRPRTGRSKFRPIADTKNLLLTIIRSVLFFNPLRVCLPVGIAIGVAALAILLFVRDQHGNVLDGTVTVLTMISLQVILIGFLADVIARMR